MCVLKRGLSILIVATSLITSRAQDIPALTVSPGQATLLVGGTQTFRAVGKDGRIRHNVRWSISPEYAASLTVRGDEALVTAKEAASSVVLTANAEGGSAEATLEIREGNTLPNGTKIWTVDKIPGCKATKMTQAVPSANGPDLYVQEECPQGTFIRALTGDGRELWRRQISGSGASLSRELTPKQDSTPAQRLNPHSVSVCDAITTGMSKEEAAKIIFDRNLAVDEKQRQGLNWVLEEEGFQCAISFDAKAGTVIKKKKTIVTD